MQLSLLFEELEAIDITPGEPQARVGLKFDAFVQRLFITAGVCILQALENQLYRLVQAVLANTLSQVIQSRGCWPMRGVHWYFSPLVLCTCNSW